LFKQLQDKLAQRGIEVTAEHKQKFLKIKEAYDVLSDPKRRKLYDQLGASGLKLMENPTEVDPMVILRNYQKNHKDRTVIVLLIALVFAAILILPILFSLKSDGTLGNDAKWVAIWTPMWVVDLFQLVAATVILFDNSDPPTHDDEEDKTEPEPKIPLVDRLYNFVSTVLFVLIQIFVWIRLDKYVHWSWFVVFIPWFLYEGLQALYNLSTAFLTTVPRPDLEQAAQLLEEGHNGEEEQFMLKIELESRYFEKIMEQQDARKGIYVNALRAWLAVFLALQLDGTVEWNWGLVLLPIWTYLFMQYVYAYQLRVWGASKLDGVDMERIETGEEKDPIKMVNAQQSNQLMASSSFLCFSQAAPLFMAILLVSRLEVSDITTFVIILPIFIAIGCCCCGVFCGICVMSCIDMDEVAKEFGQQEGGPNEGEEGYVPPTQTGVDPEQGRSSGSSAEETSPFQQMEIERKAPAPVAPVVPVAPAQIRWISIKNKNI